MDERIFNIHDLFLVVALVQAAMLACLRMALPTQRKIANGLLLAFLCAVSIELIADLLMWNEAIPLSATLRQNLLPYSFGISHFARGPLFYFYVCALIYEHFSLTRRHLLHALPSVAVLLVLAVFDINTADLQVRSGDALAETISSGIWYASSGLSIAYAAWALLTLKTYSNNLKDWFSNISTSEISWLACLSGCFLISWSWSLIVSVSADLVSAQVADRIGTAHNFVRFMLLNGLMLYSVVYAGRLLSIAPTAPEGSGDAEAPEPVIGADVLRAIMAGIDEQQLHLQPAITIEQFAAEVGLPAKLVSQALNRELGLRFFDFINRHRVAAAKQLLADPNAKAMTVLDILLAAGFNNKSSFHRFFNKVVGMSPTEYRRQRQQQR